MASDPGPAWRAVAATSGGARGRITRHHELEQLGWLAALIAACALPHVAAMPAWVLGLLGAAVGWRLMAAARHWPLPGTAMRVALTVLGAGAVGFAYRRISGLDAGSALLIIMLALKLLETRNARDRSIVILIAWFVLFGAFLREQSVVSVPQLAAGVVLGLLALAQSNRRQSLMPVADTLALAGRLLGQALPLALLLFLLFPRLPGPFWAVPNAGGAGRSGLSEQISPGDISSLALSDEVAFRVRFSGQTPRPAQLYWRGPVLERFDGRRWRTDPLSAQSQAPAPPGYATPLPASMVFDYELTLEPHAQRWLLPLDVPLSWDAEGGSLSDTLQLRRERPVDRRLAWRGRSVASGTFLDPRTPAETQLMVGEARNPRTAALGRILRARSGSDRAYLQSILGWFRREAFYYTLSPPALGSSPVDDFLFRTRSGFCEHYASAFAVLARAGGIPARVVAGYQGGERNPLGDYWIVRQSDAHAWTEVWLEGRWLRIDPTAAVAPQRIEAGLEAALPEQVTSGLPLLGQTAWLERLALGWDALNATWDRWVLAFGPDQQTALLERLGFRTPTLRELALVCAVSVSLFLLVYTALGLRPRRNRPEPVEQAWQRLCTRLGRATRPRSPGETATDYAAAVARARPELGPALRAVAELYLALRYEPGSSPAELRRFLDLSCRLRVEGR